MDNPWLMFRCHGLPLFEGIIPPSGSAHCCSFSMDGKARVHHISWGEQCWAPGDNTAVFPTGLPTLRCTGSSSQLTARGKERRKGSPAAEQGEAAVLGPPPPCSAQPPEVYWHMRSHLKMTKISVPRDIRKDQALVAPGTSFTPRFRGDPLIALKGEVVTP